MFLRFAKFCWQFIQGFKQIAVPLTSMLRTKTGFIANKSITTNSINEVNGGKKIVEVSSKKSGTRFLTSGA